jgi:hypothetical protein
VRAALLKANGEDVKVVQELLRHASAKMTLDTYSQALTPAKRTAQSKVVTMIRPKSTCTVDVPRVCGQIGVSRSKDLASRRDLNPCYRRERPRLSRLYNNLEGAGGAARPQKSCKKCLPLHDRYMKRNA